MIPKEFKDTLKEVKEYKEYKDEIDREIDTYIDPHLENLPPLAHKILEQMEDIPDLSIEQQYEIRIAQKFEAEYNKLNKSKTYFLGCYSEIYEANYQNRLKSFKEIHIDAEEHNFITDELKVLINYQQTHYINKDLNKSITYSIERTKEYLISKLEDLGFNVSFMINKNGTETLSIINKQKDLSLSKPKTSNIKWKLSKTELIELGKSIYEANCIDKENINQEEFIKSIGSFFGKELKNTSQALTKISQRTKDPLILIPKLETAMLNWIKRQLEK